MHTSRPVELNSGRPTSPARLPIALVGATVGLILVITGSFLPWLVSGQVSRNSYQISGIAARLGITGNGLANGLLGFWPFLGPVCFLPVLIAVFRWWRTAGALTVVLGVLAGLLGGAVLAVASGVSLAGMSLAAAGPTTMLAGGIVMLAGGIVLLTVRPRTVRLGRVEPNVDPRVGRFEGDSR